MQERPLRPASVPIFNTKSCNSSNLIASAPSSVKTKEILEENGQESGQKGGEEEQQLDGGSSTHSIYGTDPTTKKRFYEPHKRPGCTEEYCLSRVTQIGERICNIENKLIQLEELFEELINKPKTNSEESQTNQNGQQVNIHQLSLPNIVSTSILANNTVNGNQIRPTIFRQPGPRYTGPCLISRLLAPSKVPITTFGNGNLDMIRPTQSTLNLTATGKAKTIGSSPNPNEKQNNPVPIPYKPLPNGVRVYFLDEQRRTPNHCRICFAIFSDPDPNAPNHCIQKNPIPAAHLSRHLTPNLETYLCSICAKGGVVFKIHFLSLPAVVQHLLNQHGISGSVQIQKGYTKAVNSKNTTIELRAFINEQIGMNHVASIGNGNNSTSTVKEKMILEKLRIEERIKHPIVVSNNAKKKAVKTNRKFPDAPTFNLSGDCLDKLLECTLPCTLSERVNRLKNIERTPVNHLIVNIGQNVLAEKDFNLANIIATHADLNNTFVSNSKGRNKSANSNCSNSTTRQSRSQSRISSSVDVIAKGNRKRGRVSESESTMKNESGEEHSDDGSQSTIFDQEETANRTEESEDSDYKPNQKNTKKKKGLKPILEEQNVQTLSSASTSVKGLYQLPGNSTMIPFYRVHMPESSSNHQNTQIITPSSALMQEFGYVASKAGIYADNNKEMEEENELHMDG